MPRTGKKKKVLKMPGYCRFAAENQRKMVGHSIVMKVEEYECIRLIDYMAYTQEECLARFLVEGLEFRIEGGEYVAIDSSAEGGKKKERINMKIAVTYENGQIFQHFGHTEQFKVYEVEDGKIVGSEVVDTNGQGHGALAGFLSEGNVDVLICGGIGGGARNALAEAGIKLFPGAQGDADAQVESYLAGTLNYDPDTMCSHHGEGHGHGDHDCGGHHCG